MAKLRGLGPVFAFEWLAVSRRWQWYAARSVFVLGILAALSVVWWRRAARNPARTVQAQAEVGRLVCGAIIATQLAMVLLAAPAATAGAICLDRARGTLAHMLATDLSAFEIVVGKLAARMVPVLGILLCFSPIPALASLLGGIEQATVAGSMLVTLGVAASGCTAALALSTWGTKTHEVLLATYAGWSVWLLALPMWWGFRLVIGGAGPPSWLENSNPIWLVAAPLLWPGTVSPTDQFAFFGASLLASAGLTALAVTQLRKVSARQPSQPRSRSRWFPLAQVVDGILRLVPGPSLDANPVLWREWHRRRPSRWARAVWMLYGVMTTALSVTLIALNQNGSVVRREVASIGNGFQAGIGLLLLSVSAATVLGEERVRGNLDILLAATPLSTRSIVWGTWWGTFRTVPLLAIGPGAVAAVLAYGSGRWEGAVLIVALLLAYGAAVTSLGLALATWLHRLDLAVAINVGMLGGVTVGWFLAIVLIVPGPGSPMLAAGSPIVGITFPTMAMKFLSAGESAAVVAWWSVWIAVHAVIAALLAWVTLLTFNRCLGRVSEMPRQVPHPDSSRAGKLVQVWLASAEAAYLRS